MKCLKKIESGFTLVEVLVALSLIALLSVVAIPNLRSFSNSEELKNTTETLANVLRTAQSSSLSRINCKQSLTSASWKVHLATSNYSLLASCSDGSTVTLKTYNYSTGATPVASVNISKSTTACPNQDIDIIFTGTSASYLCSGNSNSSPITSPLVVTLQDSSNNSSTKSVTISPGGIINVQ